MERLAGYSLQFSMALKDRSDKELGAGSLQSGVHHRARNCARINLLVTP